MSNIKLFESKHIRSVFNESDSRWYFSIADVVEVLIDSANVKDYIKKMRKREPELNANWGTMCPPLNYWLPMANAEKHSVPMRKLCCAPFSRRFNLSPIFADVRYN